MKIKKCKYCETTENLVKGLRLEQECTFPCCEIHWEQYKEDKQNKRKQTTLEKYGYEYVNQVPELQEKRVQTCLEKYGVKNVNQNESIKKKTKKTKLEKYGDEKYVNVEKAKQTKLERYGDENYVNKEKQNQTMLEKYGAINGFQVEEIKEKIKQTNSERYGVEYVSQSQEIQEKIKQTSIKKYGVERPQQSEIIKEKTKQTNLEKYGVEHTLQVPEIRKKIAQTNLEKYGHTNILCSEKIKKQSLSKFRTYYYDTFIQMLEDKFLQPLFSKEDYINNNIPFKYKCLKCNKEFIFDSPSAYIVYCQCSLNSKASSYEYEIIKWLKSLDIKTEHRKIYHYGKKNHTIEIDIFLTDFNIGIEFHGIYWHSEIIKDSSFHQKKYKIFKEKDILLIQIFENEWVNKKEIVKSVILNKLQLNKNIFYARKLKIKEVPTQEAKLFLITNHLQGYYQTKTHIGLYNNDELVSICSFGKSRYSKESWELIRFCNKINTNVIGGFDRILKYFENNYKPNELLTFSDVRYFDGSIYEKNGFKFIELTRPNYFYFRKGMLELYSRIKFQKHKLKKLLKIFDENLTEHENMLKNNYLQIHDAGNLKFIKKY